MKPMSDTPVLRGLLATLACLPALVLAQALTHEPAARHDPQAMHRHHAGSGGHAAAADTRELVRYPEAMRLHTLANMRDHLLALSQIQAALARGDFDAAADTAEQRLGMSALRAHGAHEASKLMPGGMQEIGTTMHRSASRFAVAARDASVSGDVRAALAALAPVTEACVACHAAYRLN